MGETVAQLVSPERELEHVAEGEETDDFWAALGGQGDYQKAREVDRPSLAARLFHCSISPAGRLVVKEVGAYTQEVRPPPLPALLTGDEVRAVLFA